MHHAPSSCNIPRSMTLTELQPGAVVADRFAIACLAGAGGMGTVYKALDQERGRLVALKLLSDALPEHADRFAREARILAQLEHPGIVRFIGAGHDAVAGAWLAMEWLEGEDLAARLDRGPLALEETFALGIAAADALDAAHAAGVIHRDVKPSNIFLIGGDPGHIKLVDFGIARRDGPTRALTRSGTIIGTAGYLAPEQINGEPLDARSDVFSLGAVLFECLAGRPAFAGGRMVDVLARTLLEEAPDVCARRDDVSRALSSLVARMIAKDRGARPESGAAVANALRALAKEAAANSASPGEPGRREAISSCEERVGSIVVAEREAAADAASAQTVSADADVARRARLAAALARLGGRVDLVAGGRLLVTQKEAESPEEQAVRAARCALALGPTLAESEGAAKPRIAVVTGSAEVTGKPPAGDLLARAVALLAAPAPVSGVAYVDDVTRALLGGRFDVRREPAGWALAGERAIGDDARWGLGRPSPFLDRDVELRQLVDLFEECVEEGLARAALVTGPPGIGKSRLRHEAMQRISGIRTSANATPAVWAGRADTGAPFEVLASLIRGARDPSHQPTSLGQEFVDLIDAAVEARPLVLVIEDLHLADEPSLQGIERALRAFQDRPLFVLAFGRPEAHERFPGLWAERGAQQIHLGALSPRSTARLAQDALSSLDPGEVAALVERAAGNPFYLEELLRSASEGRRDELPEAVLAMEQARLVALPPAERRFLRAASIFGNVFWRRGVLHLLGEGGSVTLAESALATLLAHKLVERRATSRFPGEEELAFRQPLVCEAAHSTLTAADRARGHALAAAWLETVGEQDTRVLASHRGWGPARK
ncbi:Protein kinase [Sorangium cellulosum So ce56]|uniref:Protein kinase n=2 Tax=Sorangium cellulosum TaxID=56 RepID=A9FNY7_SORC5|nr:Protein kinase [Sorangium cellulosum So ce56]